METPTHCFEKSGLGKAPFRCVAVERVVAEREEEAKLAGKSEHVGKVGERLTIKGKVVRVASFSRPDFANPRYSQTVWVISIRDEAGNVFVSKSPSFHPEKGEALVVKATVKEHSEYKGEKQTVVQRVKALEVVGEKAA